MGAAPLIGITVDSEPPGGYSKKPWFALRQNYCEAIHRFGGVAFLLPHDLAAIPTYVERLDGLIISGGAFDIDPTLFGAENRHETVTTKDTRTRFEWDLTRAALARDMPVLGICGGQQLLHVVLGGTLIQHIPDAVPGALEHEQKNSRDEPGHTVKVTAGTLLHRIVGCDQLAVNSAHHQAAGTVAPGTVVNAVAPDGVIEGIESPAQRFCLGVQWHPEYFTNEGDARLFSAFLDAARQR
ncbi:MAG: gamma-glutamyl-gamma-aminobutyrate hydrolase family protein [Alphaproteobacteria bacterium]|nr:gamma-glutamyl-gamma-aminobutyrate hydrolase family protein [Alphaproteobacteria bacterium]